MSLANILLYFILLLLTPLLSWTVVMLEWLRKSKTNKYAVLILIIPFALIPALVNCGKVPESDLIRYLSIVDTLSSSSISTFHRDVIEANGRSEDLFWIIGVIVYKLSGSNSLVVFFWSILIYLIAGLACALWVKRLTHKPQVSIVLCIVFMTFVGITFSTSGHLIRQYLAASLGLLSFVLAVRRSWLWPFALLAAFLTHNSTYVFFLINVVAYFGSSIGTARLRMILYAILLGMGCLVVFDPSDVALSLFSYLNLVGPSYFQNDGDVPLYRWLWIAAVDATLLLMLRVDRRLDVLLLAIAFNSIVLFLLFVRGSPLLLLRYYFYSEFIILLFGAYFLARLTTWTRRVIIFPFTATMFIFFLVSLAYNPWEYVSKSPMDLCVMNIFQLLGFW